MGIQGLTDRRYYGVELGRLRKGSPKVGGKMGKNLSYFRFDTDKPGMADLFTSVYGDEPTRINVFLPSPTVDEVWSAWMEEHRSDNRLVRRCDGNEIVKRLVDPAKGVYSTEPVACLRDGGACKCKPKGKLRLIVEGLGSLDHVVFITTSSYDVVNIDGALRDLARQQESLGRDLQGVPLILERRVTMIDMPTPDGGKRRRPEALVFITPAADWSKFVIDARRASALNLSSPIAPAQFVDGLDLATGERVDEYDEYDDIQAADENPELVAPSRSETIRSRVRDLLIVAAALGALIASPPDNWADGSDDEVITLGKSLRASIDAARAKAALVDEVAEVAVE